MKTSRGIIYLSFENINPEAHFTGANEQIVTIELINSMGQLVKTIHSGL